ncbi:MAG: phosphatidate cytidylyltransferase, partial [Bacteroidota bacterium]
MNDLRSRIITSLIAVAILIPALVWAPFGVWLFCVIVSTFAVTEFFKLMGTHVRRYRLTGILANLTLWITALFEIFPINTLGFDHKIYWLELVLLLPLLQ